MKKLRFTEAKIVSVLQEYEAGKKTTLFCEYSHWEYNKAFEKRNEIQLLNTDTKAFIVSNQ